MILAELRIENYKQFLGEHRIEPPQSGIVAVIGANGVGKTTLFEAIEWCLYNPATIANADVPPRGGVGQTKVTVVLEDARDGVRYSVERTLKRKVANGAIYREDRPSEPIVQGTRQVTDYVARKLVGLGHRAFVSTFFTRQKELSFFGSLKETERRVEVGRLLGLETIRDAQKTIGEERSRAQAEARGLRLQYEEQSAGRDFPSEREAAEVAIAAQESATTAAAARLAAATEAHTVARTEQTRWQALERRDAALAQALERIGGDERAAAARRRAADEALDRLDESAASRAGLAPLAAAEPERLAAVAAHEAERERNRRRLGLDEAAARAERASRAAATALGRQVVSAGPGGEEVPGWGWTPADAAEPIAAADRLVAVVAGLDVDDACAHAEALSSCRRLVDERSEARTTWEKYRVVLGRLGAERAALVADDDPDAAAARARAEREGALAAAQAAQTRAAAAATTRRQAATSLAALRTAAASEACPSCGRPLGEAEASFMILTLEERIGELEREEASMAGERARAQSVAAAAEGAEQTAAERARAVAKVDGRIAQGTTTTADAKARHDRLVDACAAALDRAGLDGEPTVERVAEAQKRAALFQRIDRALPLLRKIGDDARRAAEEAETARAAVAALGPVAYDPEAHAASQRALKAATDAAARVAQIDDELLRRPGHEAERTAAAADIERLGAERARVEAERGALGFDPAALARADEAEQAALGAEREAARAQSAAQTALREEIGRRDALLAEQGRVAALAQRAESRGREADELERMYREFTRFDQYVAGRVTPQLAEHTGELLGAITQGKYDRVAFDENYGLTLYDEDEKFPVEAFSGGERDVAALAARLALSRLVGGQAAHPPSFLVLDEVFGSLDADRRAQVLTTLGTLAAGTAVFRQLFIISHVEDVQLSAIFDEVWQISEVDGVSRFANLTRAGGLAEL